MSVKPGNLALAEIRRENRDEVHYRARAFGPDAKQHTILIVNISPLGLMGRCNSGFEAGDHIQVQLPIIGEVAAEIRWSLGGRVGAEFETAIDLARYNEMITILVGKA